MNQYDSVIIGPIAKDTNVDYDGSVVKDFGGAVLYSGYAAANMGHNCAVFVKGSNREELLRAFSGAPSLDVFPLISNKDFVTTNIYIDENRERRDSEIKSLCDPIRPDEITPVDSSVWHLAALAKGDIPEELIVHLKQYGKIALDVQCMVRCEENGAFVYRDWEEKKKYLPMVDFLKTDAREAELLTGLTDRKQAALLLCEWGAKEVMISFNEEVIVSDGASVFACPIRADNLSGRTGRGDTLFGNYVCERLTKGLQESLDTSTQLVSLKMSVPGPYKGTRGDVKEFAKRVYGSSIDG